MNPITKQPTEQLEDLIDQYSLEHVLQTISDICTEKAEHIRTNWNDGTLSAEYDAKPWDRAAIALEKVASQFHYL